MEKLTPSKSVTHFLQQLHTFDNGQKKKRKSFGFLEIPPLFARMALTPNGMGLIFWMPEAWSWRWFLKNHLKKTRPYAHTFLKNKNLEPLDKDLGLVNRIGCGRAKANPGSGREDARECTRKGTSGTDFVFREMKAPRTRRASRPWAHAAERNIFNIKYRHDGILSMQTKAKDQSKVSKTSAWRYFEHVGAHVII